MNRIAEGDGIPAELFQALKDDAGKVLHSVCQQIWKSQQWAQDWKRSVFMTRGFYFSGSQLSHLKSEEGGVNPWLLNLFLSMDTFPEWLLCVHPTNSNRAHGTQAALVGAAARGLGCDSPTRSLPASHRCIFEGL